MIVVIETPCYPKAYTLSHDDVTPIDNGDWSLWFTNRDDAQRKANKLIAKWRQEAECPVFALSGDSERVLGAERH